MFFKVRFCCLQRCLGDIFVWREAVILSKQGRVTDDTDPLRRLNTVLAVCEYMSFAKSRQEKGCSSQAETWQVKNTLMKDFE